MNRNQLALLLVILAALGGAGFFLVKHNQEDWSPSGGRAGEKLFPNFQVNDVAAIRIEGEGALNLVRRDDGWKVQERGDYPANFSQISELLLKMGDLKVGQSDGIGAEQLARMHLEEPGHGANAATLVEFKDASGKTMQSLLMGKKHMHASAREEAPGPMGEAGFPDGRYVMLKSDPKTVLTISDPLNTVEPKATEWLSKDFFKVERPSIISFTSTNATNSWRVARAVDGAPWLLADVKSGEILDSNKVSSLASSLGYPSFVDVVTNADTAKTGLDKPLVVTIETLDHLTYVMKIGAKTPENSYYFNVAVTGSLPTERVAGQDEKPDDKKKLDEAFADKLKLSQEKLKQEASLSKWTYLVNNWLIDPFIRDRAQLMVEKKAPKPVGAAPNAAPEPEPMDAPPLETLPK